MSKVLSVPGVTQEPVLDLALDTISIGKQALIFVNTKRSAEAVAEQVAKKNGVQKDLNIIADKALKALASPTKQCRRLAYCLERGVAFHHAGLTSKQRSLVEDHFRNGNIKIISATPTLAAGINLPSFRTIIRDLKRFHGTGMISIPVLEYHQMAGRSGRPDFNDEYGEAIVIAKNLHDKKDIIETYVFGEPEAIWSKVSSMPILRTHCLSLIATEFVKDRKQLLEFFNNTFFAHQYHDTKGITKKIDETVGLLKDWGFVQSSTNNFSSADSLMKDELRATPLGRRISQLYLDPLSAHHLILGFSRRKEPRFLPLLHLICGTSEMRPLLRIRMKEYEEVQNKLDEMIDDLLMKEPSVYDSDYESYLEALKTAMLLDDWAEEKQEEYLLETYSVRPGELRARLEIADWLFYGAAELARLLKVHHYVSPLYRARRRLRYGAKEELFPLLSLKGIGRVRARQLFRNGVRGLGDVKKVEASKLASLIGTKLAVDVKKQVGVEVEEIKPGKRKGQMSLESRKFS